MNAFQQVDDPDDPIQKDIISLLASERFTPTTDYRGTLVVDSTGLPHHLYCHGPPSLPRDLSYLRKTAIRWVNGYHAFGFALIIVLPGGYEDFEYSWEWNVKATVQAQKHAYAKQFLQQVESTSSSRCTHCNIAHSRTVLPPTLHVLYEVFHEAGLQVHFASRLASQEAAGRCSERGSYGVVSGNIIPLFSPSVKRWVNMATVQQKGGILEFQSISQSAVCEKLNLHPEKLPLLGLLEGDGSYKPNLLDFIEKFEEHRSHPSLQKLLEGIDTTILKHSPITPSACRAKYKPTQHILPLVERVFVEDNAPPLLMNLLSGHVYNVPLFEVLQKPLSPPSSLAVPSLPGKTPRLPILSPLCVDGVGGTSPKPTVTVHPVGPTSTTVFTAPSTSSTMRPMPPTPVFPAIGQTRLHELVASLLKISDEQKISEHFLDRDGYHRTKDLHVAAVPEIRGWNQLLHQIGLDSSVGLITNLLQMPAGRNVAMALIAIKLLVHIQDADRFLYILRELQAAIWLLSESLGALSVSLTRFMPPPFMKCAMLGTISKELPEEELGPMTSVIQSPLPSTSNVQPNEASNAVPQVPILSATIAHASESTQVLNSASLDKILLNMLPVTSQIVSNLSYLQKRGARYTLTSFYYEPNPKYTKAVLQHQAYKFVSLAKESYA